MQPNESPYPNSQKSKLPNEATIGYQTCPNPVRWKSLVNTETGEIKPIPCKSYRCPVCGLKKSQKLYSAILRQLKKWQYARMWTFTLKRGANESPFSHRLRLQATWKSFIRSLRKTIPNVQYIRVTEIHDGKNKITGEDLWQNGYRHYHVFVNKYIPAKILIAAWKHHCRDQEGSAFISKVRTAEVLARYVVKYVLKCACAKKRARYENLHARSRLVKLFYTLINENQEKKYILIDELKDFRTLATCLDTGSENKDKKKAKMYEELELFESNLPPDSFDYDDLKSYLD